MVSFTLWYKFSELLHYWLMASVPIALPVFVGVGFLKGWLAILIGLSYCHFALQVPIKEEIKKKSETRLIKEEKIDPLPYLDLPKRTKVERHHKPVDRHTWNQFKTPEGRFSDVNLLKALIYRGGLVEELRPTAWKYLLDFCKWENSEKENQILAKMKIDEYYRMKHQWSTMSEDQIERFAEFRERRSNIRYVQGMSDLLSPILIVLKDEVIAFWCFVGLMKRMHKNFELDQRVVRQQLDGVKNLLEMVNPRLYIHILRKDSDHMYFCFQWILIAFKRELPYKDLLHLWEVLWTDIPCPTFLLFICVAILDEQAESIIEKDLCAEEILKHINGLVMKIDLQKTLCNAEAIYFQLEAVQEKLPRYIGEILSSIHIKIEDETEV